MQLSFFYYPRVLPRSGLSDFSQLVGSVLVTVCTKSHLPRRGESGFSQAPASVSGILMVITDPVRCLWESCWDGPLWEAQRGWQGSRAHPEGNSRARTGTPTRLTPRIKSSPSQPSLPFLPKGPWSQLPKGTLGLWNGCMQLNRPAPKLTHWTHCSALTFLTEDKLLVCTPSMCCRTELRERKGGGGEREKQAFPFSPSVSSPSPPTLQLVPLSLAPQLIIVTDYLTASPTVTCFGLTDYAIWATWPGPGSLQRSQRGANGTEWEEMCLQPWQLTGPLEGLLLCSQLKLLSGGLDTQPY